jgi:hypothetical protein
MATSTATRAADEQGISLREYVCTGDSGAKVDREANLIRNVKILGWESENRRRYMPEAVRKAAPLYEGVPVYFDHPRPGVERAYGDRFGETVNIRLTESGLYGDIKFNPKHPRAEQVLFDVESKSTKVGVSPDHYGDGPIRGGIRMVEAINRVKSVDIVANPATNRSFSESANEGSADMELAEQLTEALRDKANLTTDKAALETKVSQLTEQVGKLTGEKTALQEQVDAAAAATKAAEHKTKVGELLSEHKIPEKARTKEFVSLLESATLENATAAVKSLAETLKTAGTGTQRSVSGTPISESQKTEGGDKFDPKSFAAGLTGR